MRKRRRILSVLKFLGYGMVGVLPSIIKIFVLRRFFGAEIGKGVKIGMSIFMVGRLKIGDGAQIGHFNVFWNVKNVEIGDHAKIGYFNMFRGGDKLMLGRYSTILRLNVINSIIDNDCINPTNPVFELGDGSFITSAHWMDFTDMISIGKKVTIGGRLSSFWTHNRRVASPIIIGTSCYIGSDVKMAPGSKIPSFSLVGMGAVVVDEFHEEKSLIGGVPAKIIKRLNEEEIYLVTQKTRDDLPDDL